MCRGFQPWLMSIYYVKAEAGARAGAGGRCRVPVSRDRVQGSNIGADGLRAWTGNRDGSSGRGQEPKQGPKTGARAGAGKIGRKKRQSKEQLKKAGAGGSSRGSYRGRGNEQGLGAVFGDRKQMTVAVEGARAGGTYLAYINFIFERASKFLILKI